MDLIAEFGRVVQHMEWGEIVNTLEVVLVEMLGEAANSPPSTSPPPAVPAELGFNSDPQPAESFSEGYGGCTPQHLIAAPQSFEQPVMVSPGLNGAQDADNISQYPLNDQSAMQPDHLHSQGDDYSQGQEMMRDEDNTLQEVVDEVLGNIYNPPTSTLPPPALPAVQGFNSHLQPVQSLNEAFEQPVMVTPGLNGAHAASNISQYPLHYQNVMQPGHLYSQADQYAQGQHLPSQLAVPNFPGTSMAATYPAAPPNIYNNDPVVRIIEPTEHNLVPVGVLNGTVVYGYPSNEVTFANIAAPPLDTPTTKKRKRNDQERDDQPYIKKPPNAFMLFRKEQRSKVGADMGVTDSALINTILGQRWKMLPKEEQARYYEEAKKESLLHAQRYPSWSTRDNYGKKKKRQRHKAPTTAEVSPYRLEVVTQEAKEVWVTPEQPVMMSPPPSQTGAMVAHPSEISVMQTPTPLTVLLNCSHTQTAEMGPSASQTFR